MFDCDIHFRFSRHIPLRQVENRKNHLFAYGSDNYERIGVFTGNDGQKFSFGLPVERASL
jgi:hypothetical protein